MTVHVLGIRHHGPGSARSVERALTALRPNCVLIEGPPELSQIVSYANDVGMVPPIAGFVFATDRPELSVFDPFASFSPEWIALRYALANKIEVRFIDLPATHELAKRAAAIDAWKDTLAATSGPEDLEATHVLPVPSEAVNSLAPTDVADVDAADVDVTANGPIVDSNLGIRARLDPIGTLAELAGAGDAERWWEDVVELQRGPQRAESIFTDPASTGPASTDPVALALAPFEAICEAMSGLRAAAESNEHAAHFFDVDREAQREASMRSGIRQAEKDGHDTIAVVCGAWHAPVLLRESFPAASVDAATLKGLPKIKVSATWVPWTHRLLARSSGYGAGIDAPGWYDHVFRFGAERSDQLITAWMVKTARALRENEYDASPASVIEAVRLAETLAALRARPLPGLQEVNDATITVLCGGSEQRFATVFEKTHVDQRLGLVPDGTPQVPLATDLARVQKQLRLKVSALAESVELDLRTPSGIERSRLFYRLQLLEIDWAVPAANATRTTGTFKETWTLEWKPELAIPIVEASQWGTTIEAAATSAAKDSATKATLPELTVLLERVLFASLEGAVESVLAAVADSAAASHDIALLLDAVPSLARVARYGDVRKTDSAAVRGVLDGIVSRVCAGLPGASSQLDDAAASALKLRIDAMNTALGTVDDPEQRRQWNDSLTRIHTASATQGSVHGLIAGRATRILNDSEQLERNDVANTISQVLSRGADPSIGVQWIEGFFGGGGLILIHDENLLRLLDEWIASVNTETFDDLLPLLRRTFGSFAAGERRMIGSAVKDRSIGSAVTIDSGDVDIERGVAVIDTVLALLGRQPVSINQ
jgi:hypothetical protein